MIYNGGTLHGHHLKLGYIPSQLQAPKSLPESLKVVSSAEIIGLGWKL